MNCMLLRVFLPWATLTTLDLSRFSVQINSSSHTIRITLLTLKMLLFLHHLLAAC